MSISDLKVQLEVILQNSLDFQDIEFAFFGLIDHEPDEEENRKITFLEAFKNYWQTLNLEQQNNGMVVSIFVEFANKQHSRARISHLYQLLTYLVEKKFITARKTCETVLDSSYFKFENPHVWQETIQLIKIFLPQMDYKSIRAIFSVLLTQVKAELPATIMKSQNALLDNVTDIIDMGLDRSICLMPSYFVLNEIYKLYPVDNFHPHWALGEKFSKFINTFKPLAQMVTLSGHSQLVPIVGHSGSANVWNLEPATLKFPLKGPLPYRKELLESQKNLLRYIIAQPYSRDIVCSMLGLKKTTKQRCEALEDLLVDLIIVAMEKTETMSDGEEAYQLLWQHLSSQLIFFILFQFASFPHMVLALHDKLRKRKLNKGRDQLMWVLLQFISGSIQKGPLSAFSPVLKLFDLLYPGKESLSIPSQITPESTISFSMACIWVHLSKRAKSENISLHRGAPKALHVQLEYLSRALQQKQRDEAGYDIALLCNAYSTNPELFQGPLLELFGKCYETNTANQMMPGNKMTSCVKPLEVKLLDSLTVHAKMSLINGIVTRVMQIAQTPKQNIALSPALVETYSRLLIYMEIELLGIKGFIGQLLPTLLKCKALSILHTLLDMFAYRLHHTQPNYRVNLLSNLHSVAMVPFTDKRQLHLCIQNAALRLIMGFGNTDIQAQLLSQRIEPKQILSKDCEELNRILILTIARAVHITDLGNLPFAWCENILKEIMLLTPHRWSSATLSCFPDVLAEFFRQNTPTEDTSGKLLLEKVNLHYGKVKTLPNDEEIVAYCTETDQMEQIVLCIIWKMMLDHNRVPLVCYYMLKKIQAKLANYLSVFSDFLVYEFNLFLPSGQQSSTQAHVQKRFSALNDMIWKYDIITFDRFILSLTLRPFDDKNSQISFYIIKYLLQQQNGSQSFHQRVKVFTEENSPQHWLQSDCHEQLMKYQEAFPERFYFEGILKANNQQPHGQDYFPSYLGNVCLRFIPVFEILIHRLLELPSAQGNNLIEMILKDVGSLFKFHDRPITFLYNILHYYEGKLRSSPQIKKKLALTVISALNSSYPETWVCTSDFLLYLKSEKSTWEFNATYFIRLIDRFIRTTHNETPSPFPACDWRFNEFPNVSAHALFVTCVEILSLPMSGEEIGKALIDVVWQSKSSASSVSLDIMQWINAASLILTSLPNDYLYVVNQKICDIVQTRLSQITLSSNTVPLSFFDFVTNHSINSASYSDYILAVFHVTWLHASAGQFTRLSGFLKTSLKPLVKNECQLLYVFCLYGPFLQRFQLERPRCLFEVCAEFYSMLEQVCRNTLNLEHVDVIADFLYHIKYMFVGDNLREAVEKSMPNLHESLRTKLRFMAVIKREPTNNALQNVTQPQQQQPTPQVMEIINLTS